MKKYLYICIALAAAVAFIGCGDNKTNQKLIGTYVYSGNHGTTTTGNGNPGNGSSISNSQSVAVVSEVFSEFSTALAKAGLSPAKFGAIQKAIRRSSPIPSTTVSGPSGGQVVVSGSYTIISSSNFSFSVTEAMQSFKWTSGGSVYTMNGTVTITGNFNTTGATLYSMTITTSGLTFSGGGISTTISMDVTVMVDSSDNATVSGTVNGQSISGAF